MTDEFVSKLEESGYIHKLIKPDTGKTVEARLLKKKIIDSKNMLTGITVSNLHKDGEGDVSLNDGIITMTAPAGIVPAGSMPHYSPHSSLTAGFHFTAGQDWRGYNRVRCNIKPDCGGYHAPFLTLCIVNDGEKKIPDMYEREGYHVVNLTNNIWNECVWEFPDLPRDCVTKFMFYLSCFGKEPPGGADNFKFEIKDIFLDRIESPDISLGWECAADTVCYSMAGYFTHGRKIAVTAIETGDFELVDDNGDSVVFSGKIKQDVNDKGRFGIIDFSGFTTEGRYKLKIVPGNQNSGILMTGSFVISGDPFEESIWKALNFIYSERCGYPVGGGHGFCHGDNIGTHNGLGMIFCGGWHDAGDLSQQTLQTAEVVLALFENAQRVKKMTTGKSAPGSSAGLNRQLYLRLMEEACWGLDFVLRTRFGDGYRMTSIGICRWTDSLIGNADDEPVRIHNRSFDNFIMGGVAAYSSAVLEGFDNEKAYTALKIAKEDFKFALERFNKAGAEDGTTMEHTYNAGLSQYYAAAAWCASQIYKVSREEYYANEAAKFGNLMLTCQDKGEAGLEFTGFFYRDNTKKVITHFNHQSREYIYAQALVSLCETQPHSGSFSLWEESLKRHGSYLKAMRAYASVYGMQPSGVHAYNEADDAGTFPYLHVYTNYEADKDNYREQLLSAAALSESHCVRQFPVWFSFRGNSSVILAAGKAAALVGRYTNDEELIELARDQLYWHAGKNPFGQSLMYGDGYNYGQQYASMLGETLGEMPVGVQTRENEDVPYWPMANYCTYKEVWMSTVGHWLRLLADVC